MPNRNYEMRKTSVATAKGGVADRKFRVHQEPSDTVGAELRASAEQDADAGAAEIDTEALDHMARENPRSNGVLVAAPSSFCSTSTTLRSQPLA